MSNRKNKINIHKNNKPSAFMLDLSSPALENENKQILIKPESFFVILKNKFTNLFKTKKISTNSKIIYEEKESLLQTEEDIARKESVLSKLEHSFWEELAIFQFLKMMFLFFKRLFLFLQKIAYHIGWIVIFIIRFSLLLILRLLKFPEKIQKNWNIKKELKIQTEAWSNSVLNNEKFRQQNTQGVSKINKKISKDASFLNQISMSGYNNTIVHSFSWHLFFQKKYFKSALYLAGLMLVLILPFKAMTYYGVLRDLGGRILGATDIAINDFKIAGISAGDLDFYTAGEQFAQASDHFKQAQKEIDDVSTELQILASVIPSNKLRLAANAQYVLEAGEVSSKIGQQISFMFNSLSYEKEKNIKTIFQAFFDNVGPLKDNLIKLHQILNKIDINSIPVDYQISFGLLRDKVKQIGDSFGELEKLLEKMKSILGFSGEKRYLLIFQNNSEMRASGGFMGSFAIIDFRNGEVVNLEIPSGGTYDTEGALAEKIIAPKPLHIVNPRWNFWDANWWPDWKKTAKKLEWFYEHSGGSSVDGVIGITPVVMERLLQIIGPLNMQASHGVTITADNFWEITQTFAEQKPKDHPAYEPLPYKVNTGGLEQSIQQTSIDPGKKPKQIIADLMDKIKVEVPKRLNKGIFLALLGGVEQSLEEKQILFYFDDWVVQNKFEQLGWAGRVKQTKWDYLMIVNSNIGGAKSDRKIKQKITHQAEVLADGSIADTITITRTHTGVKGEKFSGVKNLDWMRIYVPLGSQFIEASGFWPPEESLFESPDASWQHDKDLQNSEENFIRDSQSWTKIYNEDNKTVFANWSQVEPGQTRVVTIRYILPFKLNIEPTNNQEQVFALLYQKQPGNMQDKFTSQLTLAGNLHPVWQYPDNLPITNNGWQIQANLSIDKFWAILIK